MKLGEILLKKNLATPDQIDVALEMQSKSGGRLGDCLIAIGVISAQYMKKAYPVRSGSP